MSNKRVKWTGEDALPCKWDPQVRAVALDSVWLILVPEEGYFADTVDVTLGTPVGGGQEGFPCHAELPGLGTCIRGKVFPVSAAW